MAQSNSSACFFPDQTTRGNDSNPLFVPCDPSAVSSACCAQGESCVGHGLCYSNNGAIYRGGCTDSSWRAAECANVCIGSDDNPSSASWLTECSFDNSLQGGSFLWTCGLLANCSSGAATFNLLPGKVMQSDITGLVSNTSATTSNAASTTLLSSSFTATTSQTSISDSNSMAVTVGAGVGVPLGVLLLVALFTTVWYRRKWVRAKNALAQLYEFRHGEDTGNAHEKVGSRETEVSETKSAELEHRHSLAEMDAAQPGGYELVGSDGDDGVHSR